MDLKSGEPFWTVKNGLMHAFPPLRSDVACDVAVIGGGITGALVADELSRHGHDVVVLDKRDVGWGSTSASTALLQYEIDTPMVELAQQYGEAAAALAYRACLHALDLADERARAVGNVDYARMDSLYWASRSRDRGDMESEFALRRAHRLPVEWLEAGDVRERFGFAAPCAILSMRAARIDPYRMAQRLLAGLERQGVPVHDRTGVARLEPHVRGVRIHTNGGQVVRATRVVIAAGYESETFLRARVACNRSTYAFITEPIDAALLGRLRTTMAWETARPYLYLRTTGDLRLLVGGADDDVDVPARRDARVAAKTRKLVKRVAAMFPWIPVEPAFAWAGTFAETTDGLPWFGAHPHVHPRVLFAMAYGGNGITYSLLGAGLLRALVERRPHALEALFGFDRRRV